MEEKELEVVIKLDPATDGLRNLTKVIDVMSGKSGIVIGTNGKYKRVFDKYIDSICDRMKDYDYESFGDLRVVYDDSKTYWIGEDKYLVGSVLVMQVDEDGRYVPITDDQVDYIVSDIKRNFVKLKAGNATFTGFRLKN